MRSHSYARCAVVVAATLLFAVAAGAQNPQPSGPLQDAARLDTDGKTVEARAIIQRVIDTATTLRAKAAAERTMAVSYGFDADCANAVKYEDMVIAFWKTREVDEPQNAFYQQGEMANEAARLCIDAGQLDVAEKYYRLGTELGLREPEPKTHPKSLWDFRVAHALARLAARRGNTADAWRQVADARKALDGDPKMAEAQERFYPYLTGYVALYTNDLVRAERDLTTALAIQGNANDPFMHALLAMTLEKKGEKAKAAAHYERAYSLATAHNPPAAFARPFTRKKLAELAR